MATVYKIELTSHWINYNEKELANKIVDLLHKDSCNNEFSIDVTKNN